MDLTYWWLVFSVLTMLFLTAVCTFVLRDCCATNPFRRYDQLHADDFDEAFGIEDPEDQKSSLELTT